MSRRPGYRKYLHMNTMQIPGSDNYHPDSKDILKSVENIPMPNEVENSISDTSSERGKHKFGLPNMFGLSNIFKGGFSTDEIVLVGLIFVLIEEGIEDEFLLIILIYLLLAGRD